MKKYNLKPMAKLVSWGQGGVDPKIMGVGPVPASRQAMQKAGLTSTISTSSRPTKPSRPSLSLLPVSSAST